MDIKFLHVFFSFIWKGKLQMVLCLSTVSATFTSPCNHKNSEPFSHPVSLSVFLIGVQHLPTSCQEKAPLRSSKPANYCLGRRMPRRPSQTSRTSQRALPRLSVDGEGKTGQTLGLPPPRTFILMDLTNTNSSKLRGHRERELREEDMRGEEAERGDTARADC